MKKLWILLGLLVLALFVVSCGTGQAVKSKAVGLKNACESSIDNGKVVNGKICDAKEGEWKSCTTNEAKVGDKICDVKDGKWKACTSSNAGSIVGSYGCDVKEEKWTKCDSSHYKLKTGPFICNGEGAWLSKDQLDKISKSAPSVVKVDLGKDLVEGWKEMGDGWNPTGLASSTNKPGPVKGNTFSFKLPYVIGDTTEMYFEVNGVTNNQDYNTEVEVNGISDWPIYSLLKETCSNEKYDWCFYYPHEILTIEAGTGVQHEIVGGVLKAFKNSDFEEKSKVFNKNSILSGVSIPVIFDLGKESYGFGAKPELGSESCTNTGVTFNCVNYDDMKIKDFYVKTGIIFDGRDWFGDKYNKKKTYDFYSEVKPNIKDAVELRFYLYGLSKNNMGYDTKISLNDQEYTLNKFLPTDYTEVVLNNGCDALWPDDMVEVKITIKPFELKKGTNTLKVTAGKKTENSKENYDDFFVDRIELVINENDVLRGSYQVKDAEKNWQRCDCETKNDGDSCPAKPSW